MTPTSSETPPRRLPLDAARARIISRWFWLGALLVFAMVVIGGITRLTGSGLSMTDWNLIMGAVPPGSEAEWREAFEQYRQFPEYKLRNSGMSLEGFKAIFFWEYLHRLLGRLTGLVFLLPFLYFWLRGWFTPRLFRRALLLFGLGALQAGMGWFMVKSGLVDVPQVSHYRLAAHLLLAVVLMGLCAWYALDLGGGRLQPGHQQTGRTPDYAGARAAEPANASSPGSGRVRNWSLAAGILLLLQITWGAFTAGLDAGLIYNTFPAMNGSWLPQDGASLQPFVLNLLENPGMVQWVHRVLGTLLLGTVLMLWRVSHTAGSGSNSSTDTYAAIDSDSGTHAATSSGTTPNSDAATSSGSTPASRLRTAAAALATLVLLQYLLGVLTLLLRVPVSLGVLHQAMALACWGAWLYFRHLTKSLHRNPRSR